LFPAYEGEKGGRTGKKKKKKGNGQDLFQLAKNTTLNSGFSWKGRGRKITIIKPKGKKKEGKGDLATRLEGGLAKSTTQLLGEKEGRGKRG